MLWLLLALNGWQASQSLLSERKSAAALYLRMTGAMEFSRPVIVSTVEKRGKMFSLVATPEECAALAARFDLVSIGALAANVTVTLVDKRRTRVCAHGRLSARDVQRSIPSGQISTLQVALAMHGTRICARQ